jgi:hypothetical protein
VSIGNIRIFIIQSYADSLPSIDKGVRCGRVILVQTPYCNLILHVFSFDTGSKCALNSGTGRRDREAEWDG